MNVQSVDMRMRASKVLRAVLGICICGAFTASASASAAECPNEGLRSGPSSQLPDCRAYELVTPSDSNGRMFGDFSPSPGGGDYFPVELLNAAGSSFVFATLGSSLAQPEGGIGGWGPPYSPDLYEAVREPSGWQTVRHLTPRPDESMFPYQGAFSSDHQYIFTHVGLVRTNSGTLGSLFQGSDAGYLGDSGGHFELIGVGSLGTEKLAQGRYISPGGEHVIFSTGKAASGSAWCEDAFVHNFPCSARRLEPNAPPNGTGAIYDRSADGPTKVVSLLPGNITPGPGKEASYQGASADGTVVAFKIEGKLFARVNNEETEEVAPSGATFGGLSADGEYLFYLLGGDIHRFDTATEADEEINSSADAELVNVSADGSHVYFISGSQLDGANGVPGQPNLYVWSGGTTGFVATVAASDTEGEPALTNWTRVVAPSSIGVTSIGPGTDSSRTTPDGTTVVFESKKQLTPYDNAGHTEIYRFGQGEGLACVSCNPGSASASSDARLQNLSTTHPTTTLHNLSSDGERVFFETAEALVGADVDEINDVYEWQSTPAPGPPALALISFGASAKYPQPEEAFPGSIPTAPNSLLGISADGSDVFFTSQDPLAPGAGVGGTPAIYDARIGGGFPAPAASEPCESTEACRPAPSPPPTLLSPASTTGAGNPKPRRCSRKHGKAAQKHRSCRRHGKGR
jgi:hypothetical protein